MGSSLAGDYQRGAPALSPFFAGAPFDLESYRRKVEDLDRRFDRSSRRRLSSLIRATSPGAAARLEEVVSGDGLFVTTGQQPGLFTGPLYTIHKIISAVQLSRALEATLGRPVMPLFWVASDDHDWEEANHLHLVNHRGELERITLEEGTESPRFSMRRRILGIEVEETLQRFIERLPTTEFAGDLLPLLREAYRPGQTVSGAFTEVIAALFAPFDLLLVDGGQPLAKELSVDLMERGLSEAPEHEALFRAQTSRLEDAGYSGQVPVLAGATNLFYEDDEGRDRIFRDGDDFVLRGSGRRFSRQDLIAELHDDPTSFSANVVLRPIIESHLFPTISYVGGPGEVSYFAQYGDLFRAYGILPPVVFPRFSVMIIEEKVRRVLDRFGLEPEDFQVPFDELSSRVIRDDFPDEVRAALDALRCRIGEGYDQLGEAALQIDPMLAAPLDSGRNMSLGRVAEVERRIVRHLKLRRETELAHLRRARVNLYPSGQPQERLLNIFQYLARYGQELLPALGGGMRVSIR